MELEGPKEREDKKENRNRKISIWASVLLSTVLTVWYAVKTPPDTPEVQKMRLFFKENSQQVIKFLRLPRDEQKEMAAGEKHPFYKKYVNSSEVQREKVKALAHVSTDYTPNQYWFNLIFLWIIFFTTFWFLGLIAEAVWVIMDRKKAEYKESGGGPPSGSPD